MQRLVVTRVHVMTMTSGAAECWRLQVVLDTDAEALCASMCMGFPPEIHVK